MSALLKRLVRSSTKFMKGSLSMFGPAMTENICFTKGFVGGMWYAACCLVKFPCGWFTLAAKSPYVSVCANMFAKSLCVSSGTSAFLDAWYRSFMSLDTLFFASACSTMSRMM